MMEFRGYEIKELIYEGKDTLIYRGYNTVRNESVILKTLYSERLTLNNIEKIKHEYEIVKRVNDIEGVAKVYDLENWRGRPVIVREDFRGELLKNKKVGIEEIFHIAIQLADIINEIHRNKVIHMDINPNNILINTNGEINVIDFGSSILMTNQKNKGKNPEQLEGTLSYISPEQTGRIDKTVDYRTDYYSLGVTLYELLTEKLPFEHSDKSELIYAHIAQKAVPPAIINEKIPQVLSEIIMKLLAKMPEDRYQSLVGLKSDLIRCQRSFIANGNTEYFKIGQEDIVDRFEISKKLYGRDKELRKLSLFIEKANNGVKQLVLVKGYAGVGKSSLVREIQKKLLDSHTYFISGKFEQFQRGIPYSALILAFESFIDQLLSKPSEELDIWRKKILKAVGNNGKIITDVLPSLELIIGKQSPVLELETVEAQNRFKFVFTNFMKVIAQEEHPIVIFIDDLQWADSASLNLIKMLMTNEAINHLLIIGAFRDKEIDIIQPLMTMKKELAKSNVITNIIDLKAFQSKDVQSLLEDTLIGLRKNDLDLKELSDFIYNKTQGNPFFAKQFLRSLYDKQYIWFDYNSVQWYWNTAEIKKLDVTDNVVELLIKKIITLRSETIQQLKYAACIGNQFDLETLTLISCGTIDSVLYDLQPAVGDGLISIVNNLGMKSSKPNVVFRFLHDRIQQAVYSLMSEEIRQSTHLNIGRLLLHQYLEKEKVENLFEIVRQLNVGKSILRNKKEFIELAELNLKAGMAAKTSSAYKLAYSYFKTGIEMLVNDAWEEYYELTLKLYSEITETAYIIGDYEQMDIFSGIVLRRGKKLTDKVKVHNIKIQAYQAQNNFKEALNTGISVLKLMEIDIPLKPKQSDIEKSFDSVKEAISGIEVNDLLNLPYMRDPEKLAAMQIMLCTISATYKAAPKLTPILACKMVELSIKYGNSPLSPGAYTFYGLLLCTVKNDVEQGYKFGKVSIKMIEKDNLQQYKVMVLDMDGYSIKHWKEHLKLTLNQFTEGYRAGIENGSFQYSACCLAGHAKNSIYLGRPLKVLEEEIADNIEIIEKIKRCSSLNYKKIFGQLVLNMQGKSKNPIVLTGEICNEQKMISLMSDTGDMVGMFFILLSKTILNYLFGEYLLAVETVNKAEENLDGVAGMVDIAVFYYFDSLSRLAIYPTLSDNEKEEVLKRVMENQNKLKNWSEYAPMNFLHKFYLVEAELMRVTNRNNDAIEFYDKSISLAKENEYINEAALANELAARFWLSKNKYRYSRLHFKEAYLDYKRWGAEAKVKALQKEYLEVFYEKFEKKADEKPTTMSTLELVDINTIMKASQAISQEIILDELIKKLISIIIENVGAEKVVFIMKEKDEFIIKGKNIKEEENIIIISNTLVDEYDDIPKSIINYVSRTNESVILENSVGSLKFGCDKYIASNRPKSMLCFPLINQRELKGIIYLENNLMTGAFTRDRLKILEVLSSQIVISLENASLYENLERSNEILDIKVKERTALLRKERDKLQKYLDIAEVLFLVLDKDEKIVLINRKGCEILGYSEEELVGRTWHDNFTREENRKDAKHNFDTIINGGLIEYSDEIIVTKVGDERIVSWHNAALTDKKGNIEGTLSCGIDITEHKRLREQLEYNKLKLEFFANLSHELKTPLNLSFSALQMLNFYRNSSLSSEINGKFDKYTNIIKQNNYRLLRLVNNLVDITKINSNSFDLDLQNHDIVDLIRMITYSVEDYIENKKRTLIFNSNIKSKLVACDPFSIERVILNLFSNALKFTDESDEISVSLYVKENSIVISVKDTGIGIPEEKQKMIFERFRQVDKSFTRNSEGSGIGLTVVKLLVELHGGNINVESSVGEFTEFNINIPIKELEEERISTNNYNDGLESLIDRIDIEFSDVYGL